jgi:hypothetical protein
MLNEDEMNEGPPPTHSIAETNSLLTIKPSYSKMS